MRNHPVFERSQGRVRFLQRSVVNVNSLPALMTTVATTVGHAPISCNFVCGRQWAPLWRPSDGGTRNNANDSVKITVHNNSAAKFRANVLFSPGPQISPPTPRRPSAGIPSLTAEFVPKPTVVFHMSTIIILMIIIGRRTCGLR